jgi:hypothetical protein
MESRCAGWSFLPNRLQGGPFGREDAMDEAAHEVKYTSERQVVVRRKELRVREDSSSCNFLFDTGSAVCRDDDIPKSRYGHEGVGHAVAKGGMVRKKGAEGNLEKGLGNVLAASKDEVLRDDGPLEEFKPELSH